MKAPREILLARHRDAEPKLDALRRGFLAELTKPEGGQEWSGAFLVWLFGGWRTLWGELVSPCRGVWAGLAGAWILILAANAALHGGSPAPLTKSSSTPGLIMTLREQQELLNELLAGRSLPGDTERPRTFSPKPRAEMTKLLTA